MAIGVHTRWVVEAFLCELDGVRLNASDWPCHVVDRRTVLASMVLTEVSNDDPECFALRGLATAVIDLARQPADVDQIAQFLSARVAYRDVLRAAFDAG